MKTIAEFSARWGETAPTGSRRYAVLIPLLEREDGLHLLFEVRSAHVRQAGEVCFPGGRMEPEETAEACALRETAEELAIPPECVTLLGSSGLRIHSSRNLVQPVLGVVSEAGYRALQAAEAEVAQTFTVPLDFFLSNPPQLLHYRTKPDLPPDFSYELLGIGPDYPWGGTDTEVPVWHYEGHIIWGLTARILCDLRERLLQDNT